MNTISLSSNRCLRSVCLLLLCARNILCTTEISEDGWRLTLHLGCLTTEAVVERRLNHKTLASIEYTQLPFAHYVLHSFYVIPAERGKGYGSELLTHVCTLLQREGARSIYIQPGPFEVDESPIKPSEYQQKTERLIKLYQRVGFQPVSRWATAPLIPVYKMLGLSEDPQYLMALRAR